MFVRYLCDSFATKNIFSCVDVVDIMDETPLKLDVMKNKNMKKAPSPIELL